LVVARAPSLEDTILYADLDLDKVDTSHARQLFLRDRRPELYGRWLAKNSS
jgi:N-carbamoylputrescine amidase